ncbi:replication protein P [Proteus mirabilis]|uniref:replication protein P n=1 Tax=Proteus mirabilis TaxID=584 RepID=UPI000F5C195F|nr:replication protein P [Proteus mirabilis]MBS3837586.1 DNA replication protein [Proteus mirabilis]MCU9582551.1 replication protein P [Proteus mirabilis]MCU9603071.1 replication protein P [Proteus mirabilis]MDF7365662.1 replication protein P [Proteus mirabilis]RQW16542.1 DNA replication protein [Proteus mirabilis]
MKTNLMAVINNRDADALARMSQGDITKKVVNSNAEKMVDSLFKSLKQLFPASVSTVFKNASDEMDAKRQWIAAFAENGITTREQLQNGMRHARASDNPFWPAVGQFIKWCKEEDYVALGLPDEDQLYELYREYCKMRGWREMKWPSNACYWMVTKIYSEMRSKSLTDNEVKKLCAKELRTMTVRIKSGETIPAPVLQVEHKITPTSRNKSLSIIANLKQKHGFR